MGKKNRAKLRLETPVTSTRKDKRLMVFVFNPKTKRINTVHFGQRGKDINRSEKSRDKFLARSAAIKNKKGELTKDNKLSANYWTRRVLWSSSKRRKK